MEHLSVDIETYSDIDLISCGLYKYAESENFEILLFAYSVDFGPVKLVDLKSGERIPEAIVDALNDEAVIKHAYNAPFEWYCLTQAGYATDLKQWRCTMLHGLYLGYTSGLAATACAVGLPEDKQKLSTGRALIRLFSIPSKPSRANGMRTRTLPEHEPDKWELFKEYCIQDVVVETEIYKKLSAFPVPDEEQYLWYIDQLINLRGVNLSDDLVDGALDIVEAQNFALEEEAKEITGLENPNSAAQLQKWLNEKGIDVDNARKDTVSELIDTLPDGEVKRMLEIRQELAKTSNKKYVAMRDVRGGNGRVRGLLQFYGANRTGRWAGRLVQVQNLPRNYIESLDLARGLVMNRDIEMLKLVYGNVSDTVSQLIRTAFIPSEENKFIISDFSAIEARVIAWLAGESWRQEVFKTHGRIYEASASQMFNVPIEKIVRGNPEYALRQKGKVAELALGYQGGVGALKAMGALNMGLAEDELPDIVKRWRSSNQRIVDLWNSIELAAVETVRSGNPFSANRILFNRETDLVYGTEFLTVKLPSGRKLYYPYPVLGTNQFGSECIYYKGVNQTTKKWEDIGTYGGKLTENIIQAIARDCLAINIKRLHEAGFDIVMHIHDEVVIDAPQDRTLDEVNDIMCQPIEWADGLILNADGFESGYYMKD